ncbi:MAG: hypothetical protein FWF05_01070 [Oscillospiraceae bacterium]|nr:hypothetical protein [Oscillospiraceae bacterium]
MKKHILLDNAFETWVLAKKNCEDILDGNPSLQVKKIFVHTLYDAIELLLKQIMIDQTMYSVRSIVLPENGETAELISRTIEIRNYLSSGELNEYFKNLKSDNDCYKKTKQEDKIVHLHTMGFTQLTDNFGKIIAFNVDSSWTKKDKEEWVKAMKQSLCKLREIRNDETLFLADADSFFEIDDFKNILGLMIQFEKIIKNQWFKPFGKNGDINIYPWLTDDVMFLKATDVPDAPDFETLVKNSYTNRRIALMLNGEQQIEDIYSLYSADFGIPLEEFASRMCVMERYGLLSVTPRAEKTGGKTQPDDGAAMDHAHTMIFDFRFDAALTREITSTDN